MSTFHRKLPSLKHTGGSVVSWNPEQMALVTAPLSSLPEIWTQYVNYNRVCKLNFVFNIPLEGVDVTDHQHDGHKSQQAINGFICSKVYQQKVKTEPTDKQYHIENKSIQK